MRISHRLTQMNTDQIIRSVFICVHLWLVFLFADVGQQGHETSPFQRRGARPLKRGTIARTLAAEQFALAGAELLHALHVLIIDESRPRAAFLRAKAAAVLAAFAEFLTNHTLATLEVRGNGERLR